MTVAVSGELIERHGGQHPLCLQDGLINISAFGAHLVAVPMAIVKVEEEAGHQVFRLRLPGAHVSPNRWRAAVDANGPWLVVQRDAAVLITRQLIKQDVPVEPGATLRIIAIMPADDRTSDLLQRAQDAIDAAKSIRSHTNRIRADGYEVIHKIRETTEKLRLLRASRSNRHIDASGRPRW